ncbi:hypothetical protein L0Z72_09315 [candidate division KSB1 bacterium]|nr:hypothetical protein [candidate division KSB1 bacterium]
MTSLCHCEDPSADGDEAEGAPLACNLVVLKGLHAKGASATSLRAQ